MEQFPTLDRSDAPEALADPVSVQDMLLEAPDRLGTDALDWLCGHALLDQ
jgi:hypothetical protein